MIFAALYEGGSFLTRDIKSQVSEAVVRRTSALPNQGPSTATPIRIGSPRVGVETTRRSSTVNRKEALIAGDDM